MQYFSLLLPCQTSTKKKALQSWSDTQVKLILAQHLASFGLDEALISIKEVSEFL